MGVRVVLVLCGVLLVAPAWSLTEFSTVVSRVRSQVVESPAEAPLVVLKKTATGTTRQAYVLRRTVAADGSFVVEAQTDQLTLVRQYSREGFLQRDASTDTAQGRSFVQTVDRARGQVHTVVTQGGKVVSDHTVDVSNVLVLQNEINIVIHQAWSAGIRDGIVLKSLSPDGSMVGDFQIVFRRTSDPLSLSAKYDYPAEFRRALVPGDYLVADMSLLGFGALFFPHHFYLAYRPSSQGLEFAAYFGENPKSALFQFVSPSPAR